MKRLKAALFTRLRRWLCLGLLVLAGCASVPLDYPKTVSSALPMDGSSDLGKSAQEWREVHGELSGFYGLAYGIEALGARLRLIEAAERSLDLQYFLIKPDQAGALITGELLRAADRGVRVRFLIDDVFTSGVDRQLAVLNSHPNIDIRLFNPLPRGVPKFMGYLGDFQRVNRRAHNKLLAADNAYAIVGGRNLADEYFGLKEAVRFDDYDVLMVGPLVEDISEGFDQFWNSKLSVPVEAFDVEHDPVELGQWREDVEEKMQEGIKGAYSDAVNHPLVQQIVNGERVPVVAPAVAVTDRPEKLENEVGSRSHSVIANELDERFEATEREVIAITPYFIPGEAGVETVKELRQEGVKVVIVTNSLASTNHVAVHSGYARYREELLAAGAEICEVRADALINPIVGEVESERLTLHTKAVLIDRRTLFLGSPNLDPRSLEINTEMGIFIDSPAVGEDFYEAIADGMREICFMLSIDEHGDLLWTFDDGQRREVLDSEPLASFGRRFMVKLFSLLPIESQL